MTLFPFEGQQSRLISLGEISIENSKILDKIRNSLQTPFKIRRTKSLGCYLFAQIYLFIVFIVTPLLRLDPKPPLPNKL